MNPSVLRGLPLRLRAIRARSPAGCTDRSVPSGRYWRSSLLAGPLMRPPRPVLLRPPLAARVAADQLSQLAVASASKWALGAAARSRALVSGGRAAEEEYREAIELLDRTRMATHLARARLVYGEWLRREKRRIDARDQLRSAFDALASMGAEAFAERARRELQATGQTVRKRSDDTRVDLTPQEEEIAQLACEGRSNSEIGAQLFIGRRTVEWHLGKVFAKLDIGSRLELDQALRKRNLRS